MMRRLRHAGVMAGVVALWVAAPGTAVAAWETPQVVSKGTGDVPPWIDIAAGANGLATAVFFEKNGTTFADAHFVRRAVTEATWSAPRPSTLTAPIVGVQWAEIAANANGDAVSSWKSGQPVDAASWPASGEAPGSVANIMTANSNGAIGVERAGNAYAASLEPAG